MNVHLRNGMYLFLIILVSGCTTLSTNIKNTKKELVGTKIDDLIIKWGVPESSIPLPSSKGVAYTWNKGGCNNNVITNNSGTITNYTANGNCAYFQWK